MINWIEENKEIEFWVDSKQSFTAFVESLWYKESAKKTKISQIFKKWNFTIELCKVSWLWDFLEIEAICMESEKEKRKQELIEIFKFYWFKEEDFVKERYLDLLKK